jgi:hypothetical protein
MAAKGQKRTHALQQTASLFDQLVCAQQECFANFQAECPCGRKIDDEVELGRLFDRNFAGPIALYPPWSRTVKGPRTPRLFHFSEWTCISQNFGEPLDTIYYYRRLYRRRRYRRYRHYRW